MKNIKWKYVWMILLLLLIIIGGTFAWLTYRSRESKLVLTIGDITQAQVTLKPYQLESNLVPVATPNYNNMEYVDVHAVNNNISPSSMKVTYNIDDETDDAILNSNLKYTVFKKSSAASTYQQYALGDFSEVSDNSLVVLEETLPANTSNDYKVYVWLNGSSGNQSNLQGNKFVAEANAEILVPSFADDDWNTIKSNVSSGTYPYRVGDTKCVHLNGFSTTNGNGCNGDFLVRIANTSTPSECNGSNFSQSACGFVVEFVDIITTRGMNLTNTIAGGWPASEMKTYLDTTIYNSLPNDLKLNIITTKTISGHKKFSSSIPNHISDDDKLYLLSSHEVWVDVDGNTSSGIDYYDTAYNDTRQLDYYASQNVTTSTTSSNYLVAKKNLNGIGTKWWLRGIIADGSAYAFYSVNDNGGVYAYNASSTFGVAPAFRIG